MCRRCGRSPPPPKITCQPQTLQQPPCSPTESQQSCASKFGYSPTPRSYPCPPEPCTKPCPNRRTCKPCPRKPDHQKKSASKKCPPPPCPSEPCSSYGERRSCSIPGDATCMPPCPPKEICDPAKRCYFARNCCCGAYMSQYICGATPDSVILDAVEGVQDIMDYLEVCADDPNYYKSGAFSDTADGRERQRMCRKRIECEPMCMAPPDR